MSDIDVLKNSPTFQMSLGAKELFHSNFWAYLFERPNIGGQFLDIFFHGIKKVEKIEREKEHIDIAIDANGKTYIIENKLKSIPNEKQITDYQRKIGNNFGGGVLTGIEKPDWFDGFNRGNGQNKWKFMSYGQIAAKFGKIMINDSTLKAIVEDYVKAIESLCNLLNVKTKDDNIPLNGDKDLKDIRIDDIYQKIKMSRFKAYLEKYKSTILGQNNCVNLKIDQGFTRASALIDICYEKFGTNNKLIYRIGVQIQGGQYKRRLQCNNSKWLATIQKICEAATWFNKYHSFVYNGSCKKSKMNGNYCKYGYDTIYQYWNIKNGDAGFGKLCEYIKEDIQCVNNIIKNIP